MHTIEDIRDASKGLIIILDMMKLDMSLTSVVHNGKLSDDEISTYIKTFDFISDVLKNWLEISIPGVSDSDTRIPPLGGEEYKYHNKRE